MLNLKYLISLVLISFSLQDKNCLVYFERCEKRPSTTISNCKNSYYDSDGNGETTEYCDECKDGYVLSNDGKNCILIVDPIQYCLEYYSDDENNLECGICDTKHALSNDRKSCTSVAKQIENCIRYSLDGEGKLLCNECNNGYAFSNDGMSCKKFENCYKLAAGDKKCSICVDNSYFHLNEEGKCERTQCKTYDENNACTKCYGGYYLDNIKNCKRIPIENCLESDSKGEKCISCLGNISPDANGKCNLPSSLIKGCIRYGSNGKCTACQPNDYQPTDDGSCQLIECEEGEYKYKYCAQCKAGYFRTSDDDDNYICMGYDGSKDTSSSDSSTRNKVEYALIILILSLLI